MLVLGRKPGDEIVINEDITIKVISMKCGRCQIGIVAAPHIPVRRGELAPPAETAAVAAATTVGQS